MVRHGTDRCAVTVGLALLAAVGTADDIPMIQTIGLLSDHFTTALLAQHLTTESPEAAGCTAERQWVLRAAYLSDLDREAWVQTARAGLAADDHRMRWLATTGRHG
ncbi:hypothetical protein [Streptomyces huiliensis]|uniref:hypothetical protein n=1 Tax=Streptomyces huiliensis TaxID=2876027 RepID=UPI001CC09212|nr:hypothetical protein [Streptomyces huiliensis]MBZ4320376.1 hypothetical protein [Streptomyces huiliensis]